MQIPVENLLGMLASFSHRVLRLIALGLCLDDKEKNRFLNCFSFMKEETEASNNINGTSMEANDQIVRQSLGKEVRGGTIDNF